MNSLFRLLYRLDVAKANEFKMRGNDAVKDKRFQFLSAADRKWPRTMKKDNLPTVLREFDFSLTVWNPLDVADIGGSCGVPW